MAPMAGGAAPERIIREEGDRPLVPGSPLSIAMVIGDFDLSGIGTVTHVEGNRVYGFGHPMFSLGACEFPMMTGYIHTVYPRASVSMKMGSPLKIVGVIDTDVSTERRRPDRSQARHAAAERAGQDRPLSPTPAPITSRSSASRSCCPTLVMSVLTNAIDTEGNLPEELTAQLTATIRSKDHEPITLSDTFSGPRYTGPMGASALFSPLASIVNILVRNSMAPVRIESIDCDVADRAGPQGGARSSRSGCSPTRSSRVRTSRRTSRSSRYKGERETIEIDPADPGRFPRGAVRGDVLRHAQQRAPPLPQRPRAARAARPGGRPAGASASRPSRSGRRSTSTSPRPSGASRSKARPCPICPAASGPFSPRSARSRAPIRSDLVAVRTPPGSSRGAVAPVHRGQGRGPVVIVVSLSRRAAPDSRSTTRNAMSQSSPAASSDRLRGFLRRGGSQGGWSRPANAVRPRHRRCSILAAAGLTAATLLVDRLGQGRDLAPGRARGVRQGHRESVVISDNGRVRLGHAVSPLGIARRRRGSGTWPGPRRDACSRRPATPERSSAATARPDAPWTVALRLVRLPGSALVVGPDGTVFAGTGPNGQVVDVTDPKHPASRPDPKVQYIWDLAADAQGNVYAATGPDRTALEACARRQMVAAVRQQVDPPALRGRRAGRSGLRRQRRRRV